jgi:EAL domain-containing protein (putative c-di-GMP-specific phosphodiesterase class I)
MHDPSHGVLRALQDLATGWHASIVAEGVETAAQLAVIRSLGISAGQGYLLARPTTELNASAVDLAALETSEQGDFLRMTSDRADRQFGAQPRMPAAS